MPPHQEGGELGVVGRGLAADAHRLAPGVGLFYEEGAEGLHRFPPLVKEVGHPFRVPVQA